MSDPSAASEAGRVPRPATVQVWDPLLRVFHWSLVIAFTLAWLSGEELRQTHEAAGYVIAGLLIVRLIWGVIGTTHARFSDFICRPRTVIGYLIDMAHFRAKRYIGHNPAGGAMVIVLLTALSATCATGILMTTDSYRGVERIEELHELTANLTLILVGLHLVGVFSTSIAHRENLARAMVTGRKRSE